MILVTGASGLLGSNILLRAVAAEREVAGICHRHSVRVPGADCYSVDLTDFAATRKFIVGLRPYSIIHCAAATNVDWCEDHAEEARRINVSASAFLAQLAREIDASFIQISTDSIFDGERGNYSEADTPRPINVYAGSKWRAEQEVLAKHPSALVIRTNFYGCNVRSKPSLAEWILNGLREGVTVLGFTDVFFCPMLAGHLAEIVLQMLDRQLYGVYNVVGSERLSKYQFALRIAALFGFDSEQVVPTSIAEAKLRAPRPMDTSLETEKIGRALGRAMPDVDSGLRRFKALHEELHAQDLQGCVAGGHQ